MGGRQQGFTLVEVLAALGVFSVAAMGLIALTNNSTRASSYLHDRFLAQVVAENVMTDAMTDLEPLQRGVLAGEETQRGQMLGWTRLVEETGTDGLKSVEVSVSDTESEQTLFTLVALRRDPA